ncbi:MAG: carbohydrate-binding family 9-like protein [Prolixibacteraceae bacterium]
MRKNKTVIQVAIVLCLLPAFAKAQYFNDLYESLFVPSRNYVVNKCDSPILIDGKADEPSWSGAAWTDDFVDIEGLKMAHPALRTRAKMLWDNNYLYLLAELEEPNIWCYYTTRDQIVFHENDFEIFIDPDCDAENYFEFELNARNTLFDLFLPKPYNKGGKADIGWDARGFKSAVSIDGTLNNPTDKDNKWMVEVAIPFECLKSKGNIPLPTEGSVLKIDFSRVEWNTVIVDGKYRKVINPRTGRFQAENNWVWNAIGKINMHIPEKWGSLLFSNTIAK